MNANVLLYDDFETLDAFGPVNILGQIPEHFHINYLSRTGDIINSSQGLCPSRPGRSLVSQENRRLSRR